MLRASFIRVPAPGSPAWTTSDAHCLNTGLIRSYDLVVGADHDGQLALLRRTRATADRGVDDVDALGLAAARASSTAVVSGSIVEWIAMTVPGLACAAELAATTSRTCSSLSTVTLMTSAVATSATLSASVAPGFGQRRHRLECGRRKPSARRASRPAAWPSACP